MDILNCQVPLPNLILLQYLKNYLNLKVSQLEAKSIIDTINISIIISTTETMDNSKVYLKVHLRKTTLILTSSSVHQPSQELSQVNASLRSN